MPTERSVTKRDAAGVSYAPIQLNLTAAGWAVAVLTVAAGFIAATSRIAVGFMIPLVAAALLDVFVSWYVLSDRYVSITPLRTVTHRPGGIPLRVEADGAPRALRVSVTFRGGIEQTVGLSDGAETVELRGMRTGVVNHLRSSTSCSMLGLGVARRWQTHSLAMMHWAPAPSATRLTTPSAIDEVARLRTYVPGDRMSRVSWPTTARTGQMYVRAAGEGQEEFVVVVNLGAAGTAGGGAVDELRIETTLELASTLGAQLLEDGHEVRLVTTELDGRAHDELRRLAMENPRLPAVLPDVSAMELHVVDRYVLDEDELARRLALAEPADEIHWPYGGWIDVSSAGIRSRP